MIASFIIFLREGFEASMIVAILLAYLNRINQRSHYRDVFAGVAVALGTVSVAGVAAYFLISHYAGSRMQTYFETATYALAAAFLTAMTFWMHKHSRTLGKELQARSEAALTTGNRWGLGLLSFQSVVREGIETMVFTLAIVFANSSQAGAPIKGSTVLIGAILGLAASLGLSYAIFRMGRKINLKRFFQVLGVVLMVFAAGLVADVVQNLQTLGWVTFGNHALWHSGALLREGSNLGDVAHQLLGYAESPTPLQVGVWFLYITTSVGYFIYLSRVAPRPTAPAPATN